MEIFFLRLKCSCLCIMSSNLMLLNFFFKFSIQSQEHLVSGRNKTEDTAQVDITYIVNTCS